MSSNLIPVKNFLGKYYPELNYSSTQDKYKNTKLDTFFEQRFYIQNNKVQMIVDPTLTGLVATISGNEIQISKEFYDHPNIAITNSLENPNQNTNPRSLYNAETFSTMAYLVCQNHTTFQITGEVDEPIYLKYKTDYETFYNSVIVFEISDNLEIEIVEEIESFSALNAVTSYILHPFSKLKLTSFYQNHVSALAFVYRNIIAQESANYSHVLLGKGSSNIVDENRLLAGSNSKSEFLGIVNSDGKSFHSILAVQPESENYNVAVDYRDVLYGKANITFFPVIIGQESSERATISISNVTIIEPGDNVEPEVKRYLKDIIERTILERMVGVERFYNNKIKFLNFP
jgi:hypothetical protein